MNSCRTHGLVLCVKDHGEADKIVTFFSPDLGKVTGIAKGAKRSKQRFVNKLEEFTLLEIIYRPARRDTLLFIVEAELKDSFLSLRRDFRRYIVAMLVLELVLRFTREHDPDSAIFSLLHWAMVSLENGEEPLQHPVSPAASRSCRLPARAGPLRFLRQERFGRGLIYPPSGDRINRV
jgi:DNA repair protein RecO (recombination protein O)